MTTLINPEGDELTTSTDDLSLSLPLSFDRKVWLSFRSNWRARLLNAILELEVLEVLAGGLECQRSILEEILKVFPGVTRVTSPAGVKLSEQMCDL